MSKLSLEQYKSKKKWSKDREFKITNSYKSIDYYRYYKDWSKGKPGKNLNLSQFSAILQALGKSLANEYLRTGQIEFPYKMGAIVLYKVSRVPYLDDGKLKITGPVNWDATLELWYNDEEAEREKILVRHEKKEVFKTKYSMYGASHKNKSYYDFKIVRALQKKIGRLADDNELEAFKAF